MHDKNIISLIPDYLKKSESYFVVITDLKGDYMYVNDYFNNRFSFVCNDFIDKPSFVAIYPEDHEACAKAVETCFANPDKVVKVDLRKPDTSTNDFYWTQWEYSLFRNQNQEVIGIFCLGHDISDTEKASRKAKQFAQKVETIMEEMTDGFYQLDREWRFVQVNSVAEKTLNMSRNQLIGKNFWHLFPDSLEFNYPEQYRKAMNENQTVKFEDYNVALDKWFSAVAYPSIEGLTVFFKDITQEKLNIEKLKEQEFLLRAIYNSTKDASTFIDPNFIIRYNNQVAKDLTKKLFGVEAKTGDYSLDFMMPTFKCKFNDYYNRVLNGETIIEDETDGQSWWQFSLYPVHDSENNIIGIAHNVKDISERKDKEMKLLESEHRLQRSLEAIPHPMLIVDENTIIQSVNDEFESTFGYLEDEVLGLAIDFLIPERFRSGHIDLYKNYLAQGGKSMKMGRNTSAITKANKEIIIDASLNTFTANGKKSIIVIMQDVTEFKQHQDIIIQQNITLRAIAWEQSHKLRTPVANILGLCDLLKNYEDETEENKLKYVNCMLDAAQDLDNIIRKIVKKADESGYYRNE
uniref:PAS domain S-box protein n=1 Tax=Flavobacterium sp. TaxID=239 RepID=UPI0040490960